MGGLSHTVSGNIASFRTPSRVPVESLKFRFLPKQAAGTPSPENPIPITGWTGLNGAKCHKNLIKPYYTESTTYYGIPITPTANGVRVTGTAAIECAIRLSSMDVRFLDEGKKYTFSLYVNGDISGCKDPYIGYYDGVSYWGTMGSLTDANNHKLTWTVPARYVNSVAPYFDMYIRIKQGSVVDFEIGLQMEAGENATAYEPYSEELIPITFPVAGTNKLDSSSIEIYTKFELVNGVYRNTETDTRTYTQLAVQLWKTKGTYIKTAKTLSVSNTGRQSLTFEVDEPDCKFIVLKHNGIQKDFILIFPRTLGLGTFTISCDVLANDPTTVGGVQLTNIQLEAGDTAHAYEPYSSDNTFYGGYIDPVAGEIVAEYTKKVFNGSETDWAASGDDWNTDNTGFCVPVSDFSHISYWTDRITSNFLKKSDSYTLNKGRFYIANSSWANFRIRMTESMTLQEFKAFLSQNNLEITYPIATPIHIPIAPQSIKAFLDHNNFWSDANDITEVTYPVTESKDILKARKLIMAGSQPHIETVSGSVASFDTYVKAPVKGLKAYFTPVQEGSGSASPSNVRSITGWTGTNVHQSKKNLLIESRRDNRYTNNIMYYRDDGGFLLKKGTYTLSKTGETCSIYIKRVSDDETLAYKYNTTWFTFTISQDENVYFNFYKGTGIDHSDSCQLELGSTATAYEPYVEGTEIEVEFPATRNLLDTSTHETSTHITKSGITFDYNSDGTLTVNGQVDSGATTGPQYRMALWTQQETGNYYLCCGAPYSTAYNETYVWDTGLSERPKKWDESTTSQSAGFNRPLSEVHLIAGHTYSINIRINRDQDKSYINDNFYVMLLKSTDTDTHYEPYGTIYGGYIDLVRNKIVATHGIYKTVFGPSNPAGVLGDYERHGYYMNVEFKPAIDLHNDGQGPYNGKTFCNVAFWQWDYYGDSLHYYIDGRVAYIMLPVGTDPDTEIEFCAELATPIEYDITPQVLKTLKGTNNIWADTNGNVDVKYWTH